jgi:hypothetical protein
MRTETARPAVDAEEAEAFAWIPEIEISVSSVASVLRRGRALASADAQACVSSVSPVVKSFAPLAESLSKGSERV